ncbi:MAG: serpin family protein [Chitinophagales bacterium]
MKHQMLLWSSFICCLFLFTQCDEAIDVNITDDSPLLALSDQYKVIDAENAFGFNALKKINETEADENIFISPLSISLAFGMAYNGADGTTQEAMQEALELNGMSLEQVNNGYKGLMNRLSQLDEAVQFDIANSIWYDEGFAAMIHDTFLDNCSEYYSSETNALNFHEPTSKDIINAWVNDNTNGKIPTILDSISPDEVMFLINAIYFKGDWKYTFDEENTTLSTFYGEDGTTSQYERMMMETSLPYFQNDLFQAVDLAYGEEDMYSMSVFLPKDNVSVHDIVNALDGDAWAAWTDGFSMNEVTFMMPKFKLEYEKTLNQTLTDLGMGIAFTGGADFSNIADANLYITKVKHKTFIEIDELGTEAAAVTSIGIGITSVNPNTPPTVNLNKPYFFVIREKQSNAILFMGKMMQPPME